MDRSNSSGDCNDTEKIVKSSHISRGRKHQQKHKRSSEEPLKSINDNNKETSQEKSKNIRSFNNINNDNDAHDDENNDNTELINNENSMSDILQEVKKDSNDQTNNQKFIINKFDKNFVKNPSILIIGKRESGKSWLIVDIAESLTKSGDIDDCVVVSACDKLNPFYSARLGNKTIHNELCEELLQSVLDTQSTRIANAKNNNTKIPNLLLILDDCITNKRIIKSTAFTNILFNSRHYNITCIFAISFPIGLSPEARASFDFVFLAGDDYISNKKRMYEHYGGVIPTFKQFVQIMDQICQDYSYMAINNCHKEYAKFEEIIMCYKATESVCQIQDLEINGVFNF